MTDDYEYISEAERDYARGVQDERTAWQTSQAHRAAYGLDISAHFAPGEEESDGYTPIYLVLGPNRLLWHREEFAEDVEPMVDRLNADSVEILARAMQHYIDGR